MKWHEVSEIFGDTPLTIRISTEVVIGDTVQPKIDGIQDFLRPFALINVFLACAKIHKPIATF